MPIDFAHIDALIDEKKVEEAYALLKAEHDGGNTSVEVKWRLAQSIYFRIVNELRKNKPQLYEAQKLAREAHEEAPTHFESLRWLSVVTGQLAEISSAKEKVEQGILFNQYLEKALAIDKNEFSLLHLHGRLAYSLAQLSWIERNLANALFGKLPSFTMDDAINRFETVTKLEPKWIENFLYLARAYAAKDAKAHKTEIIDSLNKAVALPPTNLSDEVALVDAQTMLKKYTK